MRRARTVLVFLLTATTIVAVESMAVSPASAALTAVDIVGPGGSSSFGSDVIVLSNGNIVVSDPGFDSSGAANVGAVYLYNGATRDLISVLRGTQVDDRVGEAIDEVGNGNFVVRSPFWNRGGVNNAGAATFVNGVTGLNGEVTPANSVVGSLDSDLIGMTLKVLTNGNYITGSTAFDNGLLAEAGAVTWGSGATGVAGIVSSGNSLVGQKEGDRIGTDMVALSNGNYVVVSLSWANPSSGATNAGAVTWGNGTTGTIGVVTLINSIVGQEPADRVGASTVALTNGNYVVGSPSWNLGAVADVGAATWLPGTSSVSGTLNSSNSIIGTVTGDQIGRNIVALANGNYVVVSDVADNGAIIEAGAVTWGDGVSGSFGMFSAQNSLRGDSPADRIGTEVVPLPNGDYVVASQLWDNGGAVDAGAVTWRSGTGQAAAVVDPSNSIVGDSSNDGVGNRLISLTNGNFVTASSTWDAVSGVDVGAVTWSSGMAPTVGAVSPANSLVGVTAGDGVGDKLVPLTNGNYVVRSNSWSSASVMNVGATTWRSGTVAAPGVVSESNSLVGSAVFDQAAGTISPLPNGDYVVVSPLWRNGSSTDAGAVTWASGTAGIIGVISAANSLVGATMSDEVGAVTVFADNTTAVYSRSFDNGPMFNAGAVNIAPPSGLVGTVSSDNALVGQSIDRGDQWVIAERRTLAGAYVVGRRVENKVTIVAPVVPVVPPVPDYVSLTPARLADTRPGFSTVDGLNAAAGALAGESTLELPVTGRGGVVGDAVAVSLNVTAVDAGGNGFATVHPCGEDRPTASNLNFTTGSTVPNAVIAKVGAGGKVCVFVSQAAHLVVDVNGFFPVSTSYRAGNPVRVVDTRPGEVTGDGLQQGGGAVAAGSVVEVQITGRASVPGDASAVTLNVTGLDSDVAGFFTVFPCGTPKPTASSLNVSPGATVANLVVAKIGAGGKVCIFTQATAHVVVDVNGFFPAVTRFVSLDPARLLETRAGLSTIDGLFNGSGVRPAGSVLSLKVAGRGGVPGVVATVVLNVTVTEPEAAGFATVFPCGIDAPLASNLNYAAGQTVPNAVIVKVGTDGNVCLTASQTVHLVADVVGYFPE